VRWLRRHQPKTGRLPSLGQDYGEGHRRYVESLGESAEEWLWTKPFSAPPRPELGECLRTFAHIVDRLNLEIRGQVLDVGCGPGWLSEFLARCGYWVTGIDVSADMVRLARERIARIGPIGGGFEALSEFHAMQVRDLPWTARFDAAVLYDAMHHFDAELETIRVIRSSLVPGGRLFIHEGVRPEPGSEGERELIAEMEEYGTLESPFDPEYLVEVVRKAGFTHVTRVAAVDELLDVSAEEAELERIAVRLRNPPMNTLIAVNAESDATQSFGALIQADGAWRADDEVLSLPIAITNIGSRYWAAEAPTAGQHGVVTVGPYLRPEEGNRIELPRSQLPRALSTGDEAVVDVRVPRSRVSGRVEVEIDLVREGIAWFADYGSTPVVVALPEEL
jgi:SAM-dependent methyltransferase